MWAEVFKPQKHENIPSSHHAERGAWRVEPTVSIPVVEDNLNASARARSGVGC
jgi:hypothetical protein